MFLNEKGLDGCVPSKAKADEESIIYVYNEKDVRIIRDWAILSSRFHVKNGQKCLFKPT